MRVRKTITVEGNTRVEKIIKYCLQHGQNIVSCPDLKQLTIAGLIAGVGGGNTSFQTGLFHSNTLELDLLTPDGSVLTLTPKHELFRALPRSIGTLGYVTRVKIRTTEVHPYVHIVIEHFSDSLAYFERLQKHMQRKDIHFLDGTIFSTSQLVIVIGKYVKELPSNTKLLNVANSRVYYDEIQTRNQFCMKVYDFIYRWETDLYYTTYSLPKILKSRVLRKLIPKSAVTKVQQLIGKFLPVNISQFCSDTLIPSQNAHEFLLWYDENVHVYPVYICPVQVEENNRIATFWPEDTPLIDFGIGYGVLPDDTSIENQARLCKAIEAEMLLLKGVKLPYTDTHLNEESFWKHFGNKQEYDRLRTKYGFSQFKTVYEKIRFDKKT